VDEDGRAYRSIISGGKEYRYYDDEPTYPGDVWTDISHLQQRDPERTGYATQKPLKLLDRILKPAVRDGDLVCDLCCGSGTSLVAAQRLNCRFVGVDTQADALHTAASRLQEGYVLQSVVSDDPAELEATFDPASGMVTLHSLKAPHPALPEQADGLAFVEQWRAGRIVGGEFICQHAFRRTREAADLPAWCLLDEGEGIPAVSLTDATGRRWIFQYEAN
jgi:SAM-dependent methyltransferase